VQAHEDTGVERGIDVGLNAYYTDSEGQKVENPRFFRKAERKVAQVQRQVSRPERVAQAAQKAESLTQAQPIPQGAACCEATTSTAPALAYPP
jgi:putative transposase